MSDHETPKVLSTSLSLWKSGRRTKPKRANFRMWWRWQRISIALFGMTTGRVSKPVGVGMVFTTYVHWTYVHSSNPTLHKDWR